MSHWTRDFSQPLRITSRGIPVPPPKAEPKPVEVKPVFATDAEVRKEYPMVTGLIDYFPSALAEVAHVSYLATKQHHSGKPMHWDRHKSSDHVDTIVRHLTDRGLIDTDGVRHSAKVAWRALAMLQEELEAEGAPMGRASWTGGPK